MTTIDTAIPIEKIGMVEWKPPRTVAFDPGSRDTTGLHAIAGKPGASVRLDIQLDLAAVPNAVDVVEFALFHLHQLAAEIQRRMS